MKIKVPAPRISGAIPSSFWFRLVSRLKITSVRTDGRTKQRIIPVSFVKMQEGTKTITNSEQIKILAKRIKKVT